MRPVAFLLLLSISLSFSFCGLISKSYGQESVTTGPSQLNAIQDDDSGTISIFRENNSEPILIQNAQEEIRPYIHPIVAPDGKGVLTEYRPGHHTHQTGLYWGLKELNGRDYFMDCCKPGEVGYYRKISSEILEAGGTQVKWQTVYDLLDENGHAVLTETQTWAMKDQEGKYFLDLLWKGDAKTDLTIKEFYVGGLFLRMPWYPGVTGEVINASGQRNSEAEAQRSIWTDVGIQVDGRDDLAHIAMFDHPDNNGFPIPWRVDNELGTGPSRQILGDWTLDNGETEIVLYRLVVYIGDLDVTKLTHAWIEYATEK